MAVIKYFLLLVFLCGCGLAVPVEPIAAGIVKWIDGEAYYYAPYSQNVTNNAVLRTCKSLGINVVETKKSGNDLKVIATARDRFSIRTHAAGERMSAVSIRVDFWGDHPQAELFFKEFERQLVIVDFK